MIIGLALEVLRKQSNCWDKITECSVNCEECECHVDASDLVKAVRAVLENFPTEMSGTYDNCSEKPNDCDMTLDEAIQHAEDVAKAKNDEAEEARLQEQDKYADECIKCATEHRQLAEWLGELAVLREKVNCSELPNSSDLVSRSYLLAEYDRQHQGPPGGARKIIEEAPPVQASTSQTKFKPGSKFLLEIGEKRIGLDEYSIVGTDLYVWGSLLEKLTPYEPTGDAISRQAALDLYSDLYWGDERLLAFRKELDAVFDKIRALPSVQAEQKWIPCSERMPESFKPVIVTWKNNDPASYYQYIVGKHFIGVAHYKNDTWYWYSSVTEDFLAEYGKYESEEFDEAIEVTAWMPLPEAYRGDTDE